MKRTYWLVFRDVSIPSERWFQIAGGGSSNRRESAECHCSSKSAWKRRSLMKNPETWGVLRVTPKSDKLGRMRIKLARTRKEIKILRDVIRDACALTGHPGLGVQQGILNLKEELEKLRASYATLYTRAAMYRAGFSRLQTRMTSISSDIEALLREVDATKILPPNP